MDYGEGLSYAEAVFVREYLATGDSAAAQARSGYKLDPLRRPVVLRAIREAKRSAALELGVEAKRIVAELAGIAFADVADGLVPLRSKLEALTLLGKHLRLFDERVKVTWEGKLEAQLSLSNLSDEDLRDLERISARARIPVATNGHSDS